MHSPLASLNCALLSNNSAAPKKKKRKKENGFLAGKVNGWKDPPSSRTMRVAIPQTWQVCCCSLLLMQTGEALPPAPERGQPGEEGRELRPRHQTWGGRNMPRPSFWPKIIQSFLICNGSKTRGCYPAIPPALLGATLGNERLRAQRISTPCHSPSPKSG